jgi:hypothetical protein
LHTQAAAATNECAVLDVEGTLKTDGVAAVCVRGPADVQKVQQRALLAAARAALLHAHAQ